MEAYGGVKVIFCAFLILAPDDYDWSASHCDSITTKQRALGMKTGWSPEPVWMVMVKRKVFLLVRNRSLVVRSKASYFTDLPIFDSFKR
jgi:hypothetical protein